MVNREISDRSYQKFAGDFNGDGIDELLYYMCHTGQWWVIPGDESGRFFVDSEQASWLDGWGIGDFIPLIGDFNSDGKDDIAVWSPADRMWQVAFSDGGRFVPDIGIGRSVWLKEFNQSYTSFIGDFNGDGKDDVVAWHSQTGDWQVALNDGSRFVQTAGAKRESWLKPWAIKNWTPLVGDFDGDGLDDIAVQNSITGEWQVALSDGVRFVPHPGRGDFSWLSQWVIGKPFVGDFNGDGKADLLIWNGWNRRFYVAITTKHQFVPNNEGLCLGDVQPGTFPLVGDFDGDGKAEILVKDAKVFRWHTVRISGNESMRFNQPDKTGYTGASRLQRTMERGTTALTIVYPPAMDYNFMYQRPQQILAAFARLGAEVIYMNIGNVHPQVEPVVCPFSRLPNFKVVRVDTDIHSYLRGKVVLWCPVVTERAVLERINHDYVVLDSCDLPVEEFEVHNRWLPFIEEKANLIVASASAIADEHATRQRQALVVENGADFEHFQKAVRTIGERPNNFPGRGPVIGFYGALQPWIDWDLINEVAKAYQVVLIGASTWWIDFSVEHENITILPVKDYRELPYYLSWFDVALIPFKLTRMMAGTNPVKFYEYLSAGKPIVSTRLPELWRYKHVCYFADKSNVNTIINQALCENSIEKVNFRQKVASENSWVERAKIVMRRLLTDLHLVGIHFNE